MERITRIYLPWAGDNSINLYNSMMILMTGGDLSCTLYFFPSKISPTFTASKKCKSMKPLGPP